MINQKTLENINEALQIGDIMFRFKLRLNTEKWGRYKKGDEDTFFIKLLDEQSGLARLPIDKRWDILSCEAVNEVEEVETLSQPTVSNRRELLVAYELKLWINPTQEQIEMAEQIVDMYLRN